LRAIIWHFSRAFAGQSRADVRTVSPRLRRFVCRALFGDRTMTKSCRPDADFRMRGADDDAAMKRRKPGLTDGN
jgi:hypothetical protein